jgi:excisionase family DNA binding protein
MPIFRRSRASAVPGPEATYGLPRTDRPQRNDHYSVAEAAQILGLSTRRVRQMIEEGKLEARRTPLGAFRLPGELVREEQLRRAQLGKAKADVSGGGEEASSAQPPTPISRGSPEGDVSGGGDGAEAGDSDRLQAGDQRGILFERRLSRWVLAAAVVTMLAAGLVLGLALGDANRTSGRTAPATHASPSMLANAQRVVMLIDPPPLYGIRNPNGKVVDAFIPSDFTVEGGTTIMLTIFNYDDTPHTFTSPSLGVDALIPPARAEGPSSVTVSFTPGRPGSYAWRCRVPCDSWSMARRGYMSGTVQVLAA